MPPVGANVRPLSVIAERRTCSCQGPVYENDDAHVRHHSSVSASAASGSGITCVDSYDGCHVSTNGTRSPAWTVNDASVARSTPRSSTGVLSDRQSGPATADQSSPTRRTHGVMKP